MGEQNLTIQLLVSRRRNEDGYVVTTLHASQRQDDRGSLQIPS